MKYRKYYASLSQSNCWYFSC